MSFPGRIFGNQLFLKLSDLPLDLREFARIDGEADSRDVALIDALEFKRQNRFFEYLAVKFTNRMRGYSRGRKHKVLRTFEVSPFLFHEPQAKEKIHGHLRLRDAEPELLCYLSGVPPKAFAIHQIENREVVPLRDEDEGIFIELPLCGGRYGWQVTFGDRFSFICKDEVAKFLRFRRVKT